MRPAAVVGNWKMHGSREQNARLLDELLGSMPVLAGVEVAICPAFVHLTEVVTRCEGTAVTVGAQDCSHVAEGAYTGEVSAAMLRDAGCDWVIVGHSERRQYHAESDELIAAKLGAALSAGLQPILCVGETLEDREVGAATDVVARQLEAIFSSGADPGALVVAYEPVWAIGTGHTATPAEAQDMHGFIRGWLEERSEQSMSHLRVLYGGSVKADNAGALFACEDIDGALVGGASLSAGEFIGIIDAAAAGR